MKSAVGALVAGAVFGTGLCLSGMTKPSKIQAFLDVFGRWDPSLLFVMAGAVGVHALLGALIRRRERPVFDTKFHVPPNAAIDGKLVFGAAIFGVGWGIGGFCPGPAIVAAGSAGLPALVFVFAMVAGMIVHHRARGANRRE